MDFLPNDLRYAILIQLDWQELGRICATNKTFHSLGSNELFWRLKYWFDFGEPYVELKPAKGGYFEQYRYQCLQKVKEDMYQFMYQRIDEEHKERFPRLFEEHYADFCTEIGPDVEYYYRKNDKFFTETQIKMYRHPSVDTSSTVSITNLVQKLKAHLTNMQNIAAFITIPIKKIISDKKMINNIKSFSKFK